MPAGLIDRREAPFSRRGAVPQRCILATDVDERWPVSVSTIHDQAEEDDVVTAVDDVVTLTLDSGTGVRQERDAALRDAMRDSLERD